MRFSNQVAPIIMGAVALMVASGMACMEAPPERSIIGATYFLGAAMILRPVLIMLYIAVTRGDDGATTADRDATGEASKVAEHALYRDHAEMLLTVVGLVLGLISVSSASDPPRAISIGAITLLVAALLGLFLHSLLSSTFYPTGVGGTIYLTWLTNLALWTLTYGFALIAFATVDA